MASPEVQTVLRCYPKIYFACHRRHIKDEQSKQVLSANQASILDHLDAVKGTGLLDLARHMGVTASTMSIAVDRLVRGGYIVRERDSQDARRVLLRLTKTGAGIKQQQKVLEPRLVQGMLDGLAPKDRADALRGLELLARAATELMTSGNFQKIMRGAS